MPIIKEGDKLVERAGLSEEYSENLLNSQSFKRTNEIKPSVIPPRAKVEINHQKISAKSDKEK